MIFIIYTNLNQNILYNLQIFHSFTPSKYNPNSVKTKFVTGIILLFLGSIAHAADTAEIRTVNFSCPGQVTVTYDLTTAQPTNVTLYYSHNKRDWLRAETVTGDLTAQTSGTGKTITWNNAADNVRYGKFYFKLEVPQIPEPECIMINGVCWATRNVGEPGTFVDNPEDYGLFYQWNRKKGWAAVGIVTGWDASNSTGTTWEKANDPCPSAWSVPTREELQTLLDTDKVTSQWVIQNGVAGRKFIDKATGNTLFLPAAGIRKYYDSISGVGTSGTYWSSTQGGSTSAYYLYFHSSSTGVESYDRSYAYSVRCVVVK